MKPPRRPAVTNETHVLVPSDALDELLEAIWEWAFTDFRATPLTERNEHIFHIVVRLDSALHGLTVDESWSRIEAWRNSQRQE